MPQDRLNGLSLTCRLV